MYVVVVLKPLTNTVICMCGNGSASQKQTQSIRQIYLEIIYWTYSFNRPY